MEYFVGSLATLISVYIMNRVVTRSKTINKKVKIPMYSQSYVSNMLKGLYPIEHFQPSFATRQKTQATVHFDSKSTRVLYMDGLAWFIKKVDGIDALHVAEISEEGFDENSAKRVDTMQMNKVELDKTIFIVEKLTEGL